MRAVDGPIINGTRCAEWTGGCDKDGYGKFFAGGSTRKAHRVALEIAEGRALSPKDHALHACDNPPCCEPLHLSRGNHSKNMKERAERGRQAGGKIRRKGVAEWIEELGA